MRELGFDAESAEEALKLIQEGKACEEQSQEQAGQALKCYNEALRLIITTFETPIIRYCASRVGDDLAVDMAQNVFLMARGGMSQFLGENGIMSLAQWLFTISHNVCLRESLRQGREAFYKRTIAKTSADDSRKTPKRPGRPKWFECWQDVTKEEILRGIDRLEDPKDQTILKMDMHSDLTIKDIATFFNMKEEAVRQRISRASRRLAQILEL